MVFANSRVFAPALRLVSFPGRLFSSRLRWLMRSGRSRMFHRGVVGSVRFCRAVLDGRFGRRLGGRLLHIVPCWCSLGSFVRMGFRNSLPGGGRFTLRFHRSLDRRVCGRFRVGLLCSVLMSALFFVFMLPGGGLLVRYRGGWSFHPP